MFSQVMMRTNNPERENIFYDATLGALGVPAGVFDRHRIFWLAPTGVFSVSLPINGQSAGSGNGITVGVACKSSNRADARDAARIANGGVACKDHMVLGRARGAAFKSLTCVIQAATKFAPCTASLMSEARRCAVAAHIPGGQENAANPNSLWRSRVLRSDGRGIVVGRRRGLRRLLVSHLLPVMFDHAPGCCAYEAMVTRDVARHPANCGAL